ncbi:hypothetical protein BVC80_6125g1 [Macleaya cordata]|uniref:NADH dehydrogenase [ubiquinone] 1 beta subcomplex subunit 9 n=1 Tax=Macleaya cordata TaxID=56857 RepID=A0A200R8C7_MACCD|nr:hypothetical protein BVC80_6125g1 [Macleaya cordata]
MIAAAEATYNKFRHPDPYIVPWAPGGSKFTRNPTPPAGVGGLPVGIATTRKLNQPHGLRPNTLNHIGWKLHPPDPYLQIEIVYNYGKEDND